MRKSFIAIRSVLLVLVVLLAVFVPGCPQPTGTIEVKATLCGVPWQGLVNYTLTSATGWSPISGSSVPTIHSNVAAGTWSCAYVSGGPANSFLVNITPSATQTLEAGTRITFTLNFELNQDAGISFITWTVDGDPIGKPGEPVEHEVTVCQVLDVHFAQWVDGCQGYNVTVNETSWLSITQIEGPAGVKIRVEEDPDRCAVTKTSPPQGPRPVKKSQVPSIDGKPVTPGTIIELPGPQIPVTTMLDVETTWQLVKGFKYTKSIRWLGISRSPLEPPGHRCVLFELIVPGPGLYVFTLKASADLALVGAVDVNPANNTATSPPLTLIVVI